MLREVFASTNIYSSFHKEGIMPGSQSWFHLSPKELCMCVRPSPQESDIIDLGGSLSINKVLWDSSFYTWLVAEWMAWTMF